MEKFEYADLNKMGKEQLILLVMMLYKELDIKGDRKTETKAGVYMEGTSDRVNGYYKSALKAMKEGERSE